MKYTPRQLILYIKEQGYSDREIADALECSRVTVTNVRLGHARYTGASLYRDLVGIVQNLQQQEQQLQLQGQGQEVLPAPPGRAFSAPQPIYHPPQVEKPGPGPYDQFYCRSCTFRALIPFGLSSQVLKQWVKEHPCSLKQSGQCSTN